MQLTNVWSLFLVLDGRGRWIDAPERSLVNGSAAATARSKGGRRTVGGLAVIFVLLKVLYVRKGCAVLTIIL